MASYTRLTLHDVQPLFDELGLGEAKTIAPIAPGQHNSTYRIQTAGGEKFILTLYEQNLNPLRAVPLPQQRAFQQYLYEQGIPVPELIGDVHTLKGRPAQVTRYVEHMSVDHFTQETARETGEALARFHEAAKDYDGFSAPRPSLARILASETGGALKRLVTDNDMAGNIGYISELGFHTGRLLYSEETFKSIKALPQGKIHGDAYQANFLQGADGKTYLLDFESMRDDALVIDIARTLCCMRARQGNTRYDSALIGAFLQGYNNVRPLTAGEYSVMPKLMLEFELLEPLAQKKLKLSGRRPHNGESIRPAPIRRELEQLNFAQLAGATAAQRNGERSV